VRAHRQAVRRQAVDWNLIETHWPGIMRVVLSIRAGRISSAALLRRLGNQSRRNRIYRAFRELGRAVRTIVLLRFLSEPELREGITAITSRVEAFHGFARWLMFGGGVLAGNDPSHHEKIVKFNELLASCAIYSTTVDLTRAASTLTADGWHIDPGDLATITPYITTAIRRFGDWVLNLTARRDPRRAPDPRRSQLSRWLQPAVTRMLEPMGAHQVITVAERPGT
jgi:Tn3 transposase DDE domain